MKARQIIKRTSCDELRLTPDEIEIKGNDLLRTGDKIYCRSNINKRWQHCDMVQEHGYHGYRANELPEYKFSRKTS